MRAGDELAAYRNQTDGIIPLAGWPVFLSLHLTGLYPINGRAMCVYL